MIGFSFLWGRFLMKGHGVTGKRVGKWLREVCLANVNLPD